MRNHPVMPVRPIRRPTGRATRVLAGAACALMLSAAAAGATASTAGASAVAASNGLHPLGALPPTHRVAVHLPTTALTTLPASVDLRAYAVPVGNQGAVGSCVTWAIDYGMLGWYSRKTGRVGQPFAPMYTYSQINGGVDGGSYPTAALALAQAQGSDTRADYAQGDYDWWDQPTNAEKANAAHYKISAWHTLFSGSGQASSKTALETAISTNHPVAIEIPVRPGFDNMGHASTSVDTDYTGAIRGYHEILAVGYDSVGLIVQNSWGTSWGANGFGKLSWAVVTHDVAEADDIDGFATDTAPPVVTSLNVIPTASGSISTTVPYTVTWTGLGNITSYTLTYSVNGGAPVPVSLTNIKATSYTFNAPPGSTYAFSVRAKDALSQTSPVVTSAPFTPTLIQETGAISYSGAWSHPSVTAASGGAVELTMSNNASATVTTTARQITWVASRGTNRGSARVYADGVLKATVSLYATTTQSKVIAYVFDFGSVGTHTMQIVDAGTAGHAGVDVDAFVATS